MVIKPGKKINNTGSTPHDSKQAGFNGGLSKFACFYNQRGSVNKSDNTSDSFITDRYRKITK